jgi:hypothetical protein
MGADLVICNACTVAAHADQPHLGCPGGTWCDCQHMPVAHADTNTNDDNTSEET